MLALSENHQNRIIRAFPAQERAWLAGLSDLLHYCEEHFQVTVTGLFEYQSVNIVLQAQRYDQTPIVIKLCVPTHEVKNEIKTLQFMRGDGIVDLINADPKKGILLLEKLEPGEMLSTYQNDCEATRVAAHIMQKLWKQQNTPHDMPTTEQWFSRLKKSINLPSAFSNRLIDKAYQVALSLHQDNTEKVLLHGDLHHFNILSANRQPWLAIDPKGVVGEREYDVGAWLRNPTPKIISTMDTKKVLAGRIDIFSEELGFDKQRLQAWGFAQAVLAAVWCVDDDSPDWSVFLDCAECF